MSSAVSKASKPLLRGLLHNQIKKNLAVAIGLCIVAGIAQKFIVNDPIEARYAEFYSKYDIEKDFVRMKKLGLLEACGPSD